MQLCIRRIATAIKNATDQIVHNHTQLTNDKHPFVNTLKHFESLLLSLHWKYLNQQLIMSSSCNMNVWTNNPLPIWSATRWLGLGQFWALVCQENYYPHYCTSERRPCCLFLLFWTFSIACTDPGYWSVETKRWWMWLYRIYYLEINYMWCQVQKHQRVAVLKLSVHCVQAI